MNMMTRMKNFGRGGAILQSRGEPITLAEIEARIPSVFATEAHDSRSQRYTYISTRDMLEAMTKNGFGVFQVRQGGTKFEDRRAYTKHAIRFRHLDHMGPTGQYYSHGVSQFGKAARVGDSIHEVVLVNSHDGTSCWEVASGWWVIRCLNGLMVFDANKESNSIKIPHKGNVADKVIDAAYTIINEGGEQARLIEHMQTIPINAAERVAFAEAAMALRWDEGGPDTLHPRVLATPRRPEDNEPNLWRTFNVVQENLIRGEVPYTRIRDIRNDAGQIVDRREVHAHTRAVNGIEGDLKLNRALWVLTQRMAELKAA